MKRYMFSILLSLLLTPVMAQQIPLDMLLNKIPDNLTPLNVNVPTRNQPKYEGHRGVWITPSVHHFAHDGKLVYYLGIPLPDSDYRKKVRVVMHFYEQHFEPIDVMMSAIPPIRFRHSKAVSQVAQRLELTYVLDVQCLAYKASGAEDVTSQIAEHLGITNSIDAIKNKHWSRMFFNGSYNFFADILWRVAI